MNNGIIVPIHLVHSISRTSVHTTIILDVDIYLDRLSQLGQHCDLDLLDWN